MHVTHALCCRPPQRTAGRPNTILHGEQGRLGTPAPMMRTAPWSLNSGSFRSQESAGPQERITTPSSVGISQAPRRLPSWGPQAQSWQVTPQINKDTAGAGRSSLQIGDWRPGLFLCLDCVQHDLFLGHAIGPKWLFHVACTATMRFFHFDGSSRKHHIPHYEDSETRSARWHFLVHHGNMHPRSSRELSVHMLRLHKSIQAQGNGERNLSGYRRTLCFFPEARPLESLCGSLPWSAFFCAYT